MSPLCIWLYEVWLNKADLIKTTVEIRVPPYTNTGFGKQFEEVSVSTKYYSYIVLFMFLPH